MTGLSLLLFSRECHRVKRCERTPESFSLAIRIWLARVVPRNRYFLTSPGTAKVWQNLRTTNKLQGRGSQNWSLRSGSCTTQELAGNATFSGPTTTWVRNSRLDPNNLCEVIVKRAEVWEPQLESIKNNRNRKGKKGGKLSDLWNEMLW